MMDTLRAIPGTHFAPDDEITPHRGGWKVSKICVQAHLRCAGELEEIET